MKPLFRFDPGRRNLLKGAGALAAAKALGLASLSAASAPARSTAIVEENLRPGTTDWQLTFLRFEQHRSRAIEGYCSRTSVRAGEAIDFSISTDQPTDATIDVYRMGYYGGAGARHVLRLGPVSTAPRPEPPVGAHRLRDCDWPRSASLTIPRDWLSGVYLGKLSCRAHRYQSYVIFVVRDDRQADLLVQTSDLTWQAYNKWPDTYSFHDAEVPGRWANATTRSSFNRPYGKYPQVVDAPLSLGSGEYLLWEHPLCFWLEQHGYDVTYCSNLDTHSDRAGLDRATCFVSVGHDEYWSLDMYRHVHDAVQRGLNAAFLCGNSVHWVVALDRPDHAGRDLRVMRRTGRFGGFPPEYLEQVKYVSEEPWTEHGPTEAALIGARTMTPVNGAGSWSVTNADHWLYEGTGVRNGDQIPGLIGWEHHGGPADLPGLEVIAEGKVIKSNGDESPYASTIYPGPNGNWVFNAATIYWSLGLAQTPGQVLPYSHFARPHGQDRRVQAITSNFLRKCGIHPAG